MVFYDDVTGKVLDHQRAVESRKKEMDFFRRMKVYRKVPRAKVRQMGGKIITTRWLDINKGDDKRPNYRSRLIYSAFTLQANS